MSSFKQRFDDDVVSCTAFVEEVLLSSAHAEISMQLIICNKKGPDKMLPCALFKSSGRRRGGRRVVVVVVEVVVDVLPLLLPLLSSSDEHFRKSSFNTLSKTESVAWSMAAAEKDVELAIAFEATNCIASDAFRTSLCVIIWMGYQAESKQGTRGNEHIKT